MTRIRKTYSNDYKIKAVELSKQRGNATAVARELGITVKMLYNWMKKAELGKLSIESGKAKSKEEQEIIQLRKALKNAELERDILKKAVGIFTKSDQ
jgi:transposase